MITGYNTDVKYGDTVFHVQTEDKGLGNPVIESLVYVGGQVLIAKRSGYRDLLDEGRGEKEISGRMEQQHRTVIRAIKAGKLDNKMEQVLGRRPQPGSGEMSTGILQVAKDDSGPTLDQVILDYLTTEATQEQLQLTVGELDKLVGGEWGRVELEASSSKTGKPVAGAQVTIKMISTIVEPSQLARGVTDNNGRLQLEFAVPEVTGGAAALIIAASSVIGRAESKHLL